MQNQNTQVQHRNRSLQQGSGLEIISVKSHKEIIESDKPILQKLINQGLTEEIRTVIENTCIKFLDVNSTGSNNAELGVQFAEDIIETRPTWKLDDVGYFFKFIRQRQDIEACRILGNKITGIKLMELVCIYEDYRAQEHEKFIHNRFKEPQEPKMIATKQTAAWHVYEIMKQVVPEHRIVQPTDSAKLQIDLALIEKNKNIEALCKSWIQEFDDLKPKSNGRERIAKVNGENMNVNTYMNYKLDQYNSENK